MIVDKYNNQELSLVSTEALDATSYAVEEVSATAASPLPVDDFFTVSLCYQDSRTYPNETNSTFTFKKHDEDIVGVVITELEKLGDSVHPKAYDSIIDVVQESCEILLEQVSLVGRKSLAMIVNVYVDGSALDDDDVCYNEYDDDMVDYGEAVDDEDEVHYGEAVDDDNEIYYYGIEDEEEDEDEEMTVGVIAMSTDDVKKFMSSSGGVKFVNGNQISSTGATESCTICLEEFEKCGNNKYGDDSKQQQDGDVAVLPCGHVLHADCLVPWITRGKDTCPLCRFKLIIPC